MEPAPTDEAPVDDFEGVSEIVIHAEAPDASDGQARAVVDADTIAAAAGRDLGETLAGVAGVTLQRGTSDTSKPIVRGFTERRLLLLVDGVRHEGQAWGVDHAPELDPTAAGEIAVVRGAAASWYGPDALGGVILLAPAPLRTAPGVDGMARSSWSSNGARGFLAGRIDVVPERAEALTLRLEANGAAGQAVSTPDYVLGNTASRTGNLGVSVGLRLAPGTIRLGWSHHALAAGVFYGQRASSPEALADAVAADAPLGAEAWRATYAFERPYQAVDHDRVTAHVDLAAGWGRIEAVYAFQNNNRREYDTVRDSVSGPQYHFVRRSQSLDVRWTHPLAQLGRASVEGGLGAHAAFSEHVYRGLALLPNDRSAGVGVYGWERFRLARGDVSVSARLDHVGRTAYFLPDDLRRYTARGLLDAAACPTVDARAACSRNWTVGSAAIGGVAHLLPSGLDLRAELSTGARIPSVDELYLLGTAPTLPVFVVPDPTLGAERSLGGSLTLTGAHPWVRGEVSGFGQVVLDWIQALPALGADGTPAVDVTVRGAFPTFATRARDVRVYGVDGSASVAPERPLGVDLQAAMVRIEALDAPGQVVGTPPDRAMGTLWGRPPGRGALRDVAIGVSGQWVARSRVPPDADLARPTAAYGLLGASVRFALQLAERRLLLGADGSNLLNARYREATSLLRYYADEPGRDVRVWLAVEL